MKLFRKQEPKQEPKQEKKDISHLNQISCYEVVKPVYTQDLSRKRVVEFAYLPDNEKLVLLGSMDGSYPYWVSETDIGDIETNTAIIESILHEDFTSFTGVYGEINRKLTGCYRRRIQISGDVVITPFDHGYDKKQPQYWSRFIAQDIYYYHKRLKELCGERELDGRYLEFLQAYLKKLETQISADPVKDYESKRILMDLINTEDYLLLSDNKDIRDTYIRIREVTGSLYNAYMSIVR